VALRDVNLGHDDLRRRTTPAPTASEASEKEDTAEGQDGHKQADDDEESTTARAGS
jgi:hypothetical protein